MCRAGFLPGLVSFLIAHLCYRRVHHGAHSAARPAFFASGGGGGGHPAAVAGRAGALRIPVLAYVRALGGNGGPGRRALAGAAPGRATGEPRLGRCGRAARDAGGPPSARAVRGLGCDPAAANKFLARCRPGAVDWLAQWLIASSLPARSPLAGLTARAFDASARGRVSGRCAAPRHLAARAPSSPASTAGLRCSRRQRRCGLVLRLLTARTEAGVLRGSAAPSPSRRASSCCRRPPPTAPDLVTSLRRPACESSSGAVVPPVASRATCGHPEVTSKGLAGRAALAVGVDHPQVDVGVVGVPRPAIHPQSPAAGSSSRGSMRGCPAARRPWPPAHSSRSTISSISGKRSHYRRPTSYKASMAACLWPAAASQVS